MPDNPRTIFFSLEGDSSPFSQAEGEIYRHPSDEVLKRLAWETLFNAPNLAFSPPLTEQQKEAGLKIVERFLHMQRGVHAVFSDVRDMGKKIIGNIVRNLGLLSEGHAFFSFQKAFQNIPAVICGAGPSLEQGLSALPQLRERALVLAGGSALNALTHSGFFPHLAVALDPDPPAHLFRQQSAVEAPLLYQNRVAHRLLKGCHSPRIWVPDNVSYPIEQWFMERLGLTTHFFEAGWNVATFSLQLAVAMGCNPIIMTGVDLCHPQGKAYALGVDMPQGFYTSIALDTEKETKADFLLAADWIEEFVSAHSSTTFLNASSGGLELRGMRKTTLQEVVANLPLLSRDLEGIIISALQASPPWDKKRIDDVVQEFKNHMASCLDLVEKMVALLQKWYPQDPSSKGEFILLEVECEENPLFTYVLQPLWHVWQWALCPTQENECYDYRLQKLLFFQKALQEIQRECQ